MNEAAITDAALSNPPDRNAATRLAYEWMDRWVKACDEFSEWQYRNIIACQPTPQQLAEHREALKWMLRFTRLMQSQVKDPDFPLRQFANEMDGRLLQLEEVWKLIHEPRQHNDLSVGALHIAFG